MKFPTRKRKVKRCENRPGKQSGTTLSYLALGIGGMGSFAKGRQTTAGYYFLKA